MKCKGYALKSLTHALGLSQKSLADKIGLDRGMVRECLGKKNEILPNLAYVVRGVLTEVLINSNDRASILNDFHCLFNGEHNFSSSFKSPARKEMSNKILNAVDVAKYNYVGRAEGHHKRCTGYRNAKL